MFYIPNEWGHTRFHGFCYLYRGSRLTWTEEYRWYQGAGIPHASLGVAVGIGGWKSPSSFVRVWLLSILWGFWALFYWSIFLSHSGISAASLPTVPWLQVLRLSSSVPEQHLQVWSSLHQSTSWCSKHPILSNSPVTCIMCSLSSFSGGVLVWGIFFVVPLFLLVVVCLAFVLLLLFFELC